MSEKIIRIGFMLRRILGVASEVLTTLQHGGTEGEGGRSHMNKTSLVAKKLTARQSRLVDTIVANGCSIKEAAKVAGYAGGESGRVTATKTLKLPHVQQYMIERTQGQIGLNATLAVARVMKLAMGAKSEYVQLEAAKDMLDRGGYKPVDRSQVQVAQDIRVSIDLG